MSLPNSCGTKRYKGIKRPKCCGGTGCVTCWDIWELMQIKMISLTTTKRKLKTRIHFNRVNMQRKDSRVWSAHNSRSCNMSEKIVVMHKGEKVLETVFDPAGKQPRAYLLCHGTVRYEDGVTIVEV